MNVNYDGFSVRKRGKTQGILQTEDALFMKKLISLFLTAAMLLVLFVSCGGGNEETTTGGTPVETTTTAETTSQEETTVPDVTTTTETTTVEETTTEETTTAAPETTTVQEEEIPAEKGPILYFDFETEHIEGNTVKNVAGDGMDATITGSPKYVSGPTGGNAIHFGTNAGVFDFLTIKNDPRLNFETTDEFTIDFWYKLDNNAKGWENLFSKGGRVNGWYGVWLGTNDNANQGVCWGGDTGNWKIGSVNSKEKWHHVTVVQKDGMIYMFLDGTQVNSVAAKNYTSEIDLYIGGRNSSEPIGKENAQFHGCIDDFTIYDYAIDFKIAGIDGAESGKFQYTSEDGKSIELPYRVYYPSDYDPNGDKEYPILFFLHGHGECGTDNKKQLKVLDQSNKLIDDIVAMDNCIILAPQTYCDRATNFSEWVASSTGREYMHIWDAGAGGMKARAGELSEIVYTTGLQAASALLDEFLELDTVDKDRVYIGGISMGGCGTWELIARRPDTFAAAVPVCGSGIISTASTLTDIAIWAFHGEADTTVHPEGSKNMCEAIEAAGGNVTYTSFPGVGHSVWNNAYNAKNAQGQTAAEWLLDQSK